MNIESKFSPGDVVYYASCRTAREQNPCSACNGSGRMKIEGRSLTLNCVSCNGSGKEPGNIKHAETSTRLTVGQVQVAITDSRGIPGSEFDNYKACRKREESYMCEETGIGSGSVYYVETLFSTEEEALAYGRHLAAMADARHAELAREQERQRLLYEQRFQEEGELNIELVER